MKRILLTSLALLLLPSFVAAQNFDPCPNCVLGIWDSEDLGATSNFGTMAAGQQKDVYVALNFDEGAGFDGMSGLEYSVSGLTPFIVLVSTFNNPTVELGNVAAPADTMAGSGGINIGWAACQSGDQAFQKLTLISLTAPPTDHVLRVLRKFPPSNPQVPIAHFTQCDTPQFTKASVQKGCYVVNPSGGAGEFVDGCELVTTTAVTKSTWGGLKELYREE